MDLSYSITSSPESFRKALALVGRGPSTRGAYGVPLKPLAEVEAARLLVMMGNAVNDREGAPPPNTHAMLGPLFDALAATAGRPPVWGGATSYAPMRSHEPNWRVDVIIQVLREDAAHLDWHRVVLAFDFSEASFSSLHAFRFVVTIVRELNNQTFPTAALLRGAWENARAHAEILRHAVQMPPCVVTRAAARQGASKYTKTL